MYQLLEISPRVLDLLRWKPSKMRLFCSSMLLYGKLFTIIFIAKLNTCKVEKREKVEKKWKNETKTKKGKLFHGFIL